MSTVNLSADKQGYLVLEVLKSCFLFFKQYRSCVHSLLRDYTFYFMNLLLNLAKLIWIER